MVFEWLAISLVMKEDDPLTDNYIRLTMNKVSVSDDDEEMRLIVD